MSDTENAQHVRLLIEEKFGTDYQTYLDQLAAYYISLKFMKIVIE